MWRLPLSRGWRYQRCHLSPWDYLYSISLQQPLYSCGWISRDRGGGWWRECLEEDSHGVRLDGVLGGSEPTYLCINLQGCLWPSGLLAVSFGMVLWEKYGDQVLLHVDFWLSQYSWHWSHGAVEKCHLPRPLVPALQGCNRQFTEVWKSVILHAVFCFFVSLLVCLFFNMEIRMLSFAWKWPGALG